jgi:predicted dehydrogenase
VDPRRALTDRVLRVGLIGCGKIADGHIEQIRAIGRGDVVAVCDREPLMAEQLATRFSIPGRHSDLEQMLAAERLDVLHVATPPDSHPAIAGRAFAAGCHIFMEKPFALCAADTRRILEAGAQAGRKVVVNYLYNFEQPALELQQYLREGRLGDIVHLETLYGYSLAGDYGQAVLGDPNHWVHRLPGRLFHNVLDHVLAKVARFVGDDFRLTILSSRRRCATGNPIVDAMDDELRFMIASRETGVTVSGMISAHARPVTHFLRVYGSKDSYELDFTARTITPLSRQAYPSALGRLLIPFAQARRYRKDGWRNVAAFRRHEFHYFQCMRVLLTRFYDAIEHDAPLPVPADEILRVSQLIDGIVAGVESHRERA